MHNEGYPPKKLSFLDLTKTVNGKNISPTKITWIKPNISVWKRHPQHSGSSPHADSVEGFGPKAFSNMSNIQYMATLYELESCKGMSWNPRLIGAKVLIPRYTITSLKAFCL